MEIKQKRVVYDTIELTEDSLEKIAREIVGRLVPRGSFLKDIDGVPCLYEEIDSCGRGSNWDEYVREATELDLAVFKVLEAIDAK